MLSGSTGQAEGSRKKPVRGNRVPSSAPPLSHCQDHQDELPPQNRTEPHRHSSTEVVCSSPRNMHMAATHRSPHRGMCRLPAFPPHRQLPPPPHCWLCGPDTAQGCQTLPPVPKTLTPAFLPAAQLCMGTQGACVVQGVPRRPWHEEGHGVVWKASRSPQQLCCDSF